MVIFPDPLTAGKITKVTDQAVPLMYDIIGQFFSPKGADFQNVMIFIAINLWLFFIHFLTFIYLKNSVQW